MQINTQLRDMRIHVCTWIELSNFPTVILLSTTLLLEYAWVDGTLRLFMTYSIVIEDSASSINFNTLSIIGMQS